MNAYLFLELILLLIQLMGVVLLIAFFVSAIISGIHDAPYVPSKKKIILQLLSFGEVRPGDVFYDLGSGDGRVLISAVRDFRVACATGYEVAPWPYHKSLWNIRQLGIKNIEIRRKNFFDGNYSDADCVYMYLFPKVVNKLAAKFANELKSGTRVISASFPIDLAKYPQFHLKKSQKIGSITAYLYVRN